MLRKALTAAAAVSLLLLTDVALAQDGGIWVARPHPRRGMQEETVPASALPGLAPGLTVQTSGGKPLGRVSKIVTSSDGSIRKVMVMSPKGITFKLLPTTLSVSDGVVVTTETSVGG